MSIEKTMTNEEIIDAIKTNVMYLSNGWDSATMDEDAREDFDSMYIIAMGLDIIKERMVATDESLKTWKRRCLERINEKNELKIKLAKIKEEINK